MKPSVFSNRRILLCLFLLSAFSLVSLVIVESKRDELSVISNDLQLGPITAGFDRRLTIHLKNDTSQNVQLESLTPSCSCAKLINVASFVPVGIQPVAEISIVPPHTNNTKDLAIPIAVRAKGKANGREFSLVFELKGEINPAFKITSGTPLLVPDLSSELPLPALEITAVYGRNVSSIRVGNASPNVNCIVDRSRIASDSCKLSISPLRDRILSNMESAVVELIPVTSKGQIGIPYEFAVDIKAISPLEWTPHSVVAGVKQRGETIDAAIEVALRNGRRLEICDMTFEPFDTGLTARFERRSDSTGLLQVVGVADRLGNVEVNLRVLIREEELPHPIVLSIPIQYYGT